MYGCHRHLFWHPGEGICILIAGPWPVMDGKVIIRQLGRPPLFRGAQICRLEVYKGPVVRKDVELYSPQVVLKLVNDGPLQAQEFQLEGAVVLVIALCKLLLA